MNPTEPIKRLKFGFIFLCSKYGFKSHFNSKRDLNPRILFSKFQWVDVAKRLPFFYIKANLFSIFYCFPWWHDSISQRVNQLHGKILLKILILYNVVRLNYEFDSFYFYDSIFRSNSLVVDFLHCNKIFILNAFRLMLLCPCRKAENKIRR